MTPSEATHIYNELHTILRESGLNWVSAQVLQEVALGKPNRKTISIEGEESKATRSRRRQRVEFLSTLPYSAEEQLQLLVDAIEQTIVATVEIQRSTLKMLPGDDDRRDIRFTSDIPVTQEHGYGREQAEVSAVDADKLRTLLNELRGELKHAD